MDHLDSFPPGRCGLDAQGPSLCLPSVPVQILLSLRIAQGCRHNISDGCSRQFADLTIIYKMYSMTHYMSPVSSSLFLSGTSYPLRMLKHTLNPFIL